jgi:hypothetical protein
MKNFDLKKYLAGGKLTENTEALSREEVVDLAQMVADEFTKEDAEGDRFSTYMIYKVGKVDGMAFELDTEATEQTPEEDAKYGTGEGWGGNFRVDVKPDGYEIRNSEKGGLVATMDNTGFTMLDNEQSKAELDGDTDYMQRRKEMSDYMEEGIMDKIEDFLSAAGEGVDNPTRPSLGEEKKSNKMKKSELKEMIKAAMLAEMEVEETEVFEAEEEVADEIEVEDEVGVDADVEVDADMEMDAEADGINVKQDADADLGGTVGDVQDNLEAALEAARKIGDEKLEDQIGNTLTFFTRTHVVKEAEMELEEAKDEEVKENLNESTFPMWNKIK